jgi:hypothetical protein
MNLRHAICAAAALPCLCALALPADAQQRRAARARPAAVTFDLGQLPAPRQRPVERYELREEPAPAQPAGLLQSWEVGDAIVGVGRYTVGAWPRPRTNTERLRPESTTGDTRNIAGAGMSVRF